MLVFFEWTQARRVVVVCAHAQAARSSEVADLEQRVVQLINSGSGSAVPGAPVKGKQAQLRGGGGRRGSSGGSCPAAPNPAAAGARRPGAAGACRGMGVRGASCVLRCMHAVHNVAHSSSGRWGEQRPGVASSSCLHAKAAKTESCWVRAPRKDDTPERVCVCV